MKPRHFCRGSRKLLKLLLLDTHAGSFLIFYKGYELYSDVGSAGWDEGTLEKIIVTYNYLENQMEWGKIEISRWPNIEW